MDIKKSLKRFWHFLWHEESIASYVVFFILAYLFLQFVAFPGFLLIFGLSDVTAVMTTSMIHTDPNLENTYYGWLEARNISREEIDSWSFQEGLEIGDVVFVKKVKKEEIDVGDVVVYYAPTGVSIIHRVVNIENSVYTTKGDANSNPLNFERQLSFESIKGKAILKIPYLGYPRVLLGYLIGR